MRTVLRGRLVAGGFIATAESGGDKPQVTAKPGLAAGVYGFEAEAGERYRIEPAPE
jgi:hypothetical protein